MTAFRTTVRWIHLVAAALVAVGVVVQVYLAAGQLFGAGSLGEHRDVGWLVHNLELLVFVAAVVAWLGRRDVIWSFLLAAVGTVQVLLSDADRWVGALHGAGALAVFALASVVAHRAARGLGLMRGRAAGAGGGTPPPPR